MASLALTDARVEINSVDMSQYVTSVQLPVEYEELDDTAFHDSAHSRIGGLQDSKLGLKFNQDFANSTLDSVIWAIRNTVVTVKVRATSGSITTSNPEYVGSYLVSQWNPFGNSVGELATVDVTWPLSDSDGIARNTS